MSRALCQSVTQTSQSGSRLVTVERSRGRIMPRHRARKSRTRRGLSRAAPERGSAADPQKDAQFQTTSSTILSRPSSGHNGIDVPIRLDEPCGRSCVSVTRPQSGHHLEHGVRNQAPDRVRGKGPCRGAHPFVGSCEWLPSYRRWPCPSWWYPFTAFDQAAPIVPLTQVARRLS